MKRFLLMFIPILFSISMSVSAQQKVPILVYHSIEEYKGVGQKELHVKPAEFVKQMTFLKENGFTLLTFERWAEMKKVRKPIFITFDDGYKNNLNAYEIFQKLRSDRFKPVGTIFVISDFVTRELRLSPTELKMLANSGYFSIQSHTATHPDLTKITNYAEELGDSKRKIEKITGKPVIAIAYPYGNFNNKVVKETKKYYSFGLTTTPEDYVKTGNKDELFLLPRKYVKYSTTIEEFKRIVDGE